jgi:HSP20 family protein
MLGRALMSWQSPFSQLSTFRREMDDLFTRVFGDWERAGTPWAPLSTSYTPQIESCVRENTLYIKADLPGIDPNDVEVTVEGTQLTLTGERKAEHEGHESNYFHREVRYGGFVRTFTIPEGVKAEDVQASYRHGVLELSVPLPEAMLPKKVNIAVEGPATEQKQIDRK